MTWREFLRFHLLKVLLGLVVLQLVFFAWLQYRNIRPDAVNDKTTVFEGKSVRISPLRNDIDKDEEDEIRIFHVDSAIYGDIILDDETVIYNAQKGFWGKDSFTYIISDGNKESKPAYITIDVKQNMPPKIKNDHYQIYQGGFAYLNLLSNDRDMEGDTVALSEILDPVNGEIIIDNGNYIYKNTNLSADIDSFHYTVNDGSRESEKGLVTIELISQNSPCYPWLASDVGSPKIAGSIQCDNGTVEIRASGRDIWEENDHFLFAYQTIKENFEISAKIVELENTNEWTKAFLMVRETLDAGSKNIVIGITPSHGIQAQVRNNMDEFSSNIGTVDIITAPCSFKLIRNNNIITGYYKLDSQKWIKLFNYELELNPKVYVGLAVTSHADDKLTKAKFKNINLIH